MDTNSSPEILINKLFAGAYLDEGENIGHEVINLFRADDGQNYLYITPSGAVDLDTHPISDVIFVRNLEGKTTVEVIARATGLTPVDTSSAGEITYAGVQLGRIFRDNIYHGGEEDLATTVASFRASEVRTPCPGTRLILTIDADFTTDDPSARVFYLNSVSKAIDNQSSRKYYSPANDPEAYRVLRTVLDDDDLWASKNTTTKLTASQTTRATDPTFLEIIRKENDELAFSNLLAYYFQYRPDLFPKFAHDIFGVADFSRDFAIVRESNHNIDLWIESEDSILVIENKIKSSLNGIKSDHYSQLNKYQEYTEQRISDPADAVYGKTAHYFVFTPDYNLFDLEKYHLAKPYRIVKYSEIYQFFRRHAADYLDNRYFADFLRGLHAHTMPISERNFNTMRTRFLEQIWRAR